MKEIVIKIPEELISEIDDDNYQSVISWFDTTLYCAIKNGTELPKGHKELIDTKELIQGFVKAEENMKDNGITPVFDVHEITNMILSQEVIVDADKEE